MSDKMRGLPFPDLCRYLRAMTGSERKAAKEEPAQLFGIPESLFYRVDAKCRTSFMGTSLDTPVGPAAGPHTQMAQNIISAYLCGARYIELKTVQVMDRLEIPKPCIDMEDEGYNCEWSQELGLTESFHEYCNAWILCNYLASGNSIRDGRSGPGFLFNLSIGYNMQGILSDSMQSFIDRMINARAFLQTKIDSVSGFFPELAGLKVNEKIAGSVTLSTMHGCPPEEIEQIGMYLIRERGLNTLIKLNPTLAGRKRVNEILNTRNRYDIDVPAAAFSHDLTMKQAIPIITRLRKAATEKGVSFAVKLSNTLETKNKRSVLNKSGKTVYMSGRALHPVTIETALLLQREFRGELDISFSGGADVSNIAALAGCGLLPATVCSDILKPGGYMRLGQYCHELSHFAGKQSCRDLAEYLDNLTAQQKLEQLEAYAEALSSDRYYRKNSFITKSIKNERTLPVWDCAAAPCVLTCPTQQRIPEYMEAVRDGNYRKALSIIYADNPFPFTTGLVCDHVCQYKCTRQNIDRALEIRAIKRAAAVFGGTIPLPPIGKTNRKAAVIGAGPSGLSCAWFLALAGWQVKVFERNDAGGGMAGRVIPEFRLKREELGKDIERIREAGAVIEYNACIDKQQMDEIKKQFDAVYLAVGAAKDKKLNIEGEEQDCVFGALSFLARARKDTSFRLSGDVCVIGGGNSAMDAARAALRLTDGKVSIVYRRTTEQMPADREELQAVIHEHIAIHELLAPDRIELSGGDLVLHCQRMKLAKKDKSGRQGVRPVAGSMRTLECGTVITAVGQESDLSFAEGLALQRADGGQQGALVYYGGDCMRGPSSIISAVADGKKAAALISGVYGENAGRMKPAKDPASYAGHFRLLAERSPGNKGPDSETVPEKNRGKYAAEQGMDKKTAEKEAWRCLGCDEICNICISVCPNRALFAARNLGWKLPVYFFNSRTGEAEQRYDLHYKQPYQIFRIADFCNECGNCATFCPSGGAPYKTKRTVCLDEQLFIEEENALFAGKNEIRFKQRNDSGILWQEADRFVYTDGKLTAEFSIKDFSLLRLDGTISETELVRPAELRLAALLLEQADLPPFRTTDQDIRKTDLFNNES
ncbi:MAG: putative selenate reductase subunit YgfK [Spirochaetales bacterium]|nr:putative selenate reductase subunit YgfK [Spirochaetales bacterium]